MTRLPTATAASFSIYRPTTSVAGKRTHQRHQPLVLRRLVTHCLTETAASFSIYRPTTSVAGIRTHQRHQPLVLRRLMTHCITKTAASFSTYRPTTSAAGNHTPHQRIRQHCRRWARSGSTTSVAQLDRRETRQTVTSRFETPSAVNCTTPIPTTCQHTEASMPGWAHFVTQPAT